MPNKTNRMTITITCLLAIVALMAGVFISLHTVKTSPVALQLHGTLLDKPRAVQPFSLEGIDHKPFNNARLNHQWTMVFFGFTHCQSMCPTAMAELSKTYRLLQEKSANPLPQVVMISVDPERDSLDTLSHYVKAFNSHFYGAVGTKASIKAMTRELGIAYIKVAPKGTIDASNYDIEHTGTVMLFNPDGALVAFFTTPHEAESLAKDYLLLTASTGKTTL